MTITDIKYITTSTSSLNYGSTMTEEDLKFYTSGYSSVNFPFGQSEKDAVKLSVYGFDDRLIKSSMIYFSGSHVLHTQSYYDVNNKYTTYSYSAFNSNAPVLNGETSSLFVDLAKALNDFGINDGNYRITMELLRNMVGSEKSSDDKLMIDVISTNRDEIALIPKTLNGEDTPINRDFSIFSNNQIAGKEIADDLTDMISSPEIYTVYYAAKKQDEQSSELFKFYYGFNRRENEAGNDVDVISFLTDLYYGVRKGGTRNSGQISTNDILGIYDQFKNWLYQNYEIGVSFQDVQDYYYSIFKYVVDQELNRITNTKPAEYDQILNFLQTVYFDSIFYPKIYSLQAKYNTDIAGYFKNYINYNGGNISILNRKVVKSSDSRYHDKLVLKLETPLPQSVNIGDDVWITNNFGFLPIVQNLYYFTENVIKTISLRGPNFNAKVESKGNTTEALSMEQLVAQTGSLYNEIISKIGAANNSMIDTTDYRYFENFVNFSSARFRVDAFKNKKSQIDYLQENLADLRSKLNANPDDKFFAKEISDTSSQIDELESSMDGYENFLYNNAVWVPEQDASASLYDRSNTNSLVNNLPQFIVEDYDQNSDYIIFVGMVGHFFDNISLMVKQFTDKNNYSSSPNYGISVNIVEDMLGSLGWEAEISKENLPLLLSSFSQKQFDVGSELYNLSRALSETERNQIIWKRILNTLPYIYKTKGTEASLSSLLSCFGIPKNVIKLKEYGGIQNVHNLQDTTLYVLDEVKYEPYFSGSGEYFKFNWTGSAQTLEFNFAFDSEHTSEEGHVFRLANCPNNWVIGVYRDKGLSWGRLFFSIDNGYGVVKTIMTDKAPLFDGSTYHAMLRRDNASIGFGMYNFTPSQIDQYPIKYDVVLQRADDARITFEATASQYLSGSYNSQFRLGSYVYMGNYSQNTASLNIDPEAFFGNIDEIKLWEAPLDDARFESHTLHQNSYNSDSPENMIMDNLIRISFERPINLNDPSKTVQLTNLAFRKDFPAFDAINFPSNASNDVDCNTQPVATFPYQFTRKETRQTVKLPDYGSSKFRSNKINYVEQELAASLSSTERSSLQSSQLVSVDSNRLGIFFSPAEIQNSEIIKFFGEYPLSELIGDPSTVYQSSYFKFEKFRQIFYDQGFGNIDYQFFMNVVRFYFDKAMFKYIRSIVPARAKLVDGILVEPTILERPKIQLKPLVKENIPQKESHVQVSNGVVATQSPKLSDVLNLRNDGTTIIEDVNQRFFPDDADQYGFGVYADNGITFYNGEYYRADVVKVKKQYQVKNKYNLPSNTDRQSLISGTNRNSVSANPALLSDYQISTNLNGSVQTVTSSYYKINLAKLPTLHEYVESCSFLNVVFSGSVDFNPGFVGYTTNYAVSSSHHIEGLLIGTLIGNAGQGEILNPGINIIADYISPYPLLYSGLFDYYSGSFHFYGSIDGGVPATINLAKFTTKFYTPSSGPSIFDTFRYNTKGAFFGSLAAGISYRKDYSMQYYPYNAALLNGYYTNHYKYSKQQFSLKEVNSYDNTNAPFKWKKNSQNKKTTVDPLTGLLDNSDPVETKTV